MKKLILKLGILGIILLIIISFLSPIFTYKHREKLSASKSQLLEMPKDSVDVFFIGASGIYAAISPIKLYEEYGITSFNLASSTQPPIIKYYTFVEALKRHSPEVIVVDFVSLTVNNSPTKMEPSYQRGFTSILDPKLKIKAILELDKHYETTSKLSYLSAFYRYHHRWSELQEEDFRDTNPYEPYKLGGHIDSRVEPVKYIDNYFDEHEETSEPYAQSKYFYEKIITLAKEKGIEVLSLSTPRVNARYGRQMAIEKFSREWNIENIDLSAPEQIESLKLDLERDFYNQGHVSNSGNSKVTSFIGKHLQEKYGLHSNLTSETKEIWEDLLAEYKLDVSME